MTLAQTAVVAMAADERISYAIGAGALLLLLSLMAALVAFGGGRDHS